MHRFGTFFASLVSLAFVACAVQQANSGPLVVPGHVEAPLDARVHALRAGDLPGVLAQFADDAVVRSSGGRVSEGLDQIRAFSEDQIRRNQDEVLAGPREIDGNFVKWTVRVSRDDWRALGIAYLEVDQEALVESGRIKRFTNTFRRESAEKLRVAREKNQPLN